MKHITNPIPLMHSKTARRCRPLTAQSGFTLVELLVVIAIIGILAALVIPTMSRVRQSARQSTCVSRLRELGTAFQLYINENKGTFPHPRNESGNRWPFYIAPYLGPYEVSYGSNGRVNGLKPGSADIFQNPLVRDPVNPIIPGNTAAGTFGYNVELEGKFGLNAPPPVRITDLSRPSNFPVLATSQRDDTVKGGLMMTSGGPSPKAADYGYAGPTEDTGPAPNYGPRAVFLFADWHVQARDVCNANAWPWNEPDGNAFKVQ